MEGKRDYRQQNIQKFYFNEDGKLVVESNRGVWVDGEQHVKMYGNFSCNAKTMGVIIHHLKGIPVEIGVGENVHHSIDSVFDDIFDINEPTIEYCIIGSSEERIKEYEEKLAEKHYTNSSIELSKLAIQQKYDSYKSEIETLKKAYSHLRGKVIAFNALPWYKRLFKKIEIK